MMKMQETKVQEGEKEMERNQTVRRDWLKKQIEAGKMEIRCLQDLTDDYAYDSANNGGRTEWMDGVEWVKNQSKNLYDWKFRSTSGGAYREKDGKIIFYVYSNLCYELREKGGN